jgi:hypothetical protein
MKSYKNKNWLEKKYWNEELSKRQIAKLCNVGLTTIHYWMSKLNISRRSVKEAKNTENAKKTISKISHLAQANHCNLSKKAIDFINGELLGDGCLQSFSSYSASLGYTFKYYEYAKYILDTLQSFGINCGKIYQGYNKDTKGNFHYSYKFYSYRYVELFPFYKKWYLDGKITMPKDIELDPITLMQFYLEDGSLNKLKNKNRMPYIVLYTNNFSISDVNWLIIELNKIGFKATRQPSRNIINISTYSTKDFLNYIGECPVKCYSYKFIY